MSDLLTKLKAGRAAQRRVTLPSKDGQGVELGLRVLTEADYMEAGLAAIETLRAAGHEDVNVANADLYEQAKVTELLARALVDPATGKPLVESAAELRGALARADKMFLIDQYLDHEREYSPSEVNMSAEDFAQLLEDVKKNPATPRLSDSSTATLKRLVQSLAEPEAS
ncbi:MAG: hypothetical protein CVU73_12865 [Deltaproteobacteria bacterium HGW-Deltaproteobacteria-8]|jgi:hypothetical protein|nr:MAG: hypothetical protein CVU73_12865 [Deltaproteobacteria bacterium HGW-Deltaproteobacteria-8]